MSDFKEILSSQKIGKRRPTPSRPSAGRPEQRRGSASRARRNLFLILMAGLICTVGGWVVISDVSKRPERRLVNNYILYYPAPITYRDARNRVLSQFVEHIKNHMGQGIDLNATDIDALKALGMRKQIKPIQGRIRDCVDGGWNNPAGGGEPKLAAKCTDFMYPTPQVIWEVRFKRLIIDGELPSLPGDWEFMKEIEALRNTTAAVSGRRDMGRTHMGARKSFDNSARVLLRANRQNLAAALVRAHVQIGRQT